MLIAHYFHFYIHGYTYEGYALEHQPLFGLLEPCYRYGTRAVEVFWCLSGFIFFLKYGEVIYAKRMPARRFFWLRFSRLYPLHVLTLVAVALLQWAYHARYGVFYIVELNNLKHFILNLVFVQYWGFQDGFSFNAPAWSVSVELVAYACFYAVTRWFGASFFTGLLCLAGCAGLNLLLGAEPVIGRCLFYFYSGGLACLAFRLIREKFGRYQILATLAGLAIIAGCTRRFTVTLDVDFVLNFEIPVVLVVLALNSFLLENRVGRAVDALGNLTYASYLLHFPLQILFMLVAGFLGWDRRFAGSPVLLVAYVLVVLIVSHVVYRRIEMPAQERIRRRFTARPAPPAGDAGVRVTARAAFGLASAGGLLLF